MKKRVIKTSNQNDAGMIADALRDFFYNWRFTTIYEENVGYIVEANYYADITDEVKISEQLASINMYAHGFLACIWARDIRKK